MGKSLLVLVLGFSIFGTIAFHTGPRVDTARAGDAFNEMSVKMLAREIALTGFNIARRRVESGETLPGRHVFAGEHQGGRYEVAVEQGIGPEGTTKVVATGFHALATRERGRAVEARHVVEGHFESTNDLEGGGSGEPVPVWASYGLIADGSINFNGSSSVYPVGYPHSHTGNANVHSNSRLTVNGNSNFRGFGTFGADVQDPGILNRTQKYFSPSFSPDRTDGSGEPAAYDPALDGPAYRHAEQIEIPAFQAEDHMHQADEKHMHGNLQLKNETIQGGTEDDPHIIYVHNELQIKNKVRIRGHVVFLVRRNITIRGGFENVGTGSHTSNVAFYTNQSLNFNGSSSIHGQILANNLNLNGSGRIVGSVATRGHVNFNGSRNIQHVNASAGLTRPFFDPPETEPSRPRLTDYREWDTLASADESPSLARMLRRN